MVWIPLIYYACGYHSYLLYILWSWFWTYCWSEWGPTYVNYIKYTRNRRWSTVQLQPFSFQNFLWKVNVTNLWCCQKDLHGLIGCGDTLVVQLPSHLIVHMYIVGGTYGTSASTVPRKHVCMHICMCMWYIQQEMSEALLEIPTGARIRLWQDHCIPCLRHLYIGVSQMLAWCHIYCM